MKQDDTKEKILEEALKLFSMKGYEAVSVGEIAKAVGIKAPSLYNHYPSKQAIFEAIVEETAQRYDKFTDKIDIHVGDSGKDIGVFSEIDEAFLFDKVRKIFVYSLHDETTSRFRRMMTIEQFRSEELSRLYTKRYIERIEKYHEGIFRVLIKKGEIKEADPETLSMMYISPVITLLGVCDREPDLKDECIEKLGAHVHLFFTTFNKKAAKKEG
mgnify:FL=1